MTTYVCYHLPSDKDEAEHPNAFAINKQAEDVTLRDVKNAFPLPGEYHFRFKVRMESGSYWLDCTDDSAFVPVFGPRRIVAKVLRLSWQDRGVLKQESKSAPPQPKAAASVSYPDHADLFGGITSVAKPASVVSDLDLFS